MAAKKAWESVEVDVRVPVRVPIRFEVGVDVRGRHVAKAWALGAEIVVRATGRDLALERCQRAVARRLGDALDVLTKLPDAGLPEVKAAG